MNTHLRLRVLAPVVFGVAALVPSGAFAQQAPIIQPPHQAAFCGSADIAMAGQGELMLPQPDTVGTPDEGVLNYSAVRGAIMHMEGNLALLKLEHAGVGNAAPNYELAGDDWAVVQLPSECSPSDFKVGAPILAVGTPTGTGILEAVEVTQTA